MRRTSGDLTVTVNRLDVIAKITENREAHREIFEDALSGYRTQVIDQLESRLEKMKAGKMPTLYIGLPEPRDHTEDYDRVLEMLGMHTSDTIEIGQTDFALYVRDDWEWKAEFAATAANYTQLA